MIYFQELWELAESLGEVKNQGLSPEQIDTLPTSTYSSSRASSASSTHGRGSGAEEGECKVCLTEFNQGDNLRTLPCCHRFHSQCIDQWIKVIFFQ